MLSTILCMEEIAGGEKLNRKEKLMACVSSNEEKKARNLNFFLVSI
jgi:hypothetical protein